MAWIVRLVKIDADGEGPTADVMAISRPEDLRDIADLGLTLADTKQLLAGLQQKIVAAQARDHAIRRPACPRCGGKCRVKDHQDHAVATLFGKVAVRLPRFRRAHAAGARAASTGDRIADRHRNWIGFRPISPPS